MSRFGILIIVASLFLCPVSKSLPVSSDYGQNVCRLEAESHSLFAEVNSNPTRV